MYICIHIYIYIICICIYLYTHRGHGSRPARRRSTYSWLRTSCTELSNVKPPDLRTDPPLYLCSTLMGCQHYTQHLGTLQTLRRNPAFVCIINYKSRTLSFQTRSYRFTVDLCIARPFTTCPPGTPSPTPCVGNWASREGLATAAVLLGPRNPGWRHPELPRSSSEGCDSQRSLGLASSGLG